MVHLGHMSSQQLPSCYLYASLGGSLGRVLAFEWWNISEVTCFSRTKDKPYDLSLVGSEAVTLYGAYDVACS